MLKNLRYFISVLILVISFFISSLHVVVASTPLITEYNIPGAPTYAFQITSGPDGALWFTEKGTWKIGRMTTNGVFTEYPTPAQPEDIIAGPDGALWFTEPSVDKVGRITTNAEITTYPTGYNSAPRFITVGSDGALWMEEWNASIARMTTDGVVTHYPVPGASFGGLMGITNGPDGAVWFVDYSDNRIGKITTAGVVTMFTIPTANSYPYGIVGGSDGAVWFGETVGNKIGRITPDGTITEYAVPTTYGNSPHPSILTLGQDGAVWFIEENNNAIARASSTGEFTEYQVPTTSTDAMTGLTLGPDGALWYVRYGSESKVGQFNLQVEPTPTPTETLTPTPTNTPPPTPTPANVPPVVESITASPNPVQVNTLVAGNANFTDANISDNHTAVWDWGDGMTSTGNVTESNGSGSVSGSHVYLTAGVYEIRLTVTDNSSGEGKSVYQYLSVYNPTPQGLFTGVRLFQSPMGAYTQNPSLTGQVRFGVSAKYTGTTATGDVSLNFNAGNFTFESTSIQSFVTLNGKATLTGTGTVNGNTGYTFLATGIDGTGEGQRLIRFQIKNGSMVLYDTQLGASATADPTTPVTAGQVIVH